jgi:putative membrane protein
MAKQERTLIVCIDGDNDVGVKAKIDTPILGREGVIQAATALAIADPEEADANAMFGAVKIQEQLSKEYPNEIFQVATITGDSRGGIIADRKMISELNEVISEFNATGVILVTDGYSDEELVPIIQSRIPINSIHHVVVKHSERIEETWAVVLRYVKMLMEDPQYARISLGVPGIILVILGFLIASGQVENAGMMITFVLGIVLFLKGFGLDEKLSELRPRLPPAETWLNLISSGLGFILAILGTYQGVIFAWKFVPQPSEPLTNLSFWASNFPMLFGAFLEKGTDLIVLGIAASIIGDAASHYIRRQGERIWTNFIGIVFLFWMRLIVLESAKILKDPEITLNLFSPLIYYTVAGVTTTIIIIVLVYRQFGREYFTNPLRQER